MVTERPFSCIIPAYNEARHIGEVLKVVSGIPAIGEVICVDDGSSDGTSALIAAGFPAVKLVRIRRNRGKSAAVRAGSQQVTKQYVLLLDADLRGLKAQEINDAILFFLSHRATDMVILRRMQSPWRLRWSRIDTLLAGERILHVSDLRAVLSDVVEDYGLELAINMYMFELGKTVYWAPSSARNTFKCEKLPPLRGLALELRMYGQLLRTTGVRNIFLLLAQFGRRKIPASRAGISPGGDYRVALEGRIG